MLGSLIACLTVLSTAAIAAGQELTQAISLYERGRYQQAVETLSEKGAPQNQGEVHFWLGKSYLKLHQRDDAIRELKEAVQMDPSNGTYHLWLGRAYGDKASHVSFFSAPGWARKVAQEFETAVKLSPRDMQARFDLLEFYLEAPGMVGGGKQKALAEIEEIVEISAVQGFKARARAYGRDKDWAEARRQLTEATTQFPEDPVAHTNLADFLLSRHDYAGAEASASTALQLDPGNLNARFIQSAAEVGLKRDVPQAVNSLSELASGPLRDPDLGFEDIYYWLGKGYQEEGKPAEAREAYQTALRFDPEYDAARSALANLRS